MSIRKVTSQLPDPKYVRALEKVLREMGVDIKNALGRVEQLEKRPRAANNMALIPLAPIGLSCSGSTGGVSATFIPVTQSTTGVPIEIALHELVGTSTEQVASGWVMDESVANATQVQQVAMSKDGSVVAVAGRLDGVLVSTDAGKTWSASMANEYPDGDGFWSVAMSSDGAQILAGAYEGLWRSADFGASWVRVLTNSCNGVSVSADGMVLLAGVNIDGANLLQVSQDAGSTWATSTVPDVDVYAAWGSFAMSDDGARLYAANEAQDYLRTSTDLGATWTALSGMGFRYWHDVACSADGSNVVAITSYSPDVMFTSTDFGATGTLRAPLTSSGGITAESISSSFDGTVLGLAAGSEGVLVSRDGGATWVQEFVPAADSYWHQIASSEKGVNLAALGGGGRLAVLADAAGGGKTERHFGFTGGTSGAITTPSLEPGDWAFRVRAISTRGAVGAFSKPFTMTIA